MSPLAKEEISLHVKRARARETKAKWKSHRKPINRISSIRRPTQAFKLKSCYGIGLINFPFQCLLIFHSELVSSCNLSVSLSERQQSNVSKRKRLSLNQI